MGCAATTCNKNSNSNTATTTTVAVVNVAVADVAVACDCAPVACMSKVIILYMARQTYRTSTYRRRACVVSSHSGARGVKTVAQLQGKGKGRKEGSEGRSQ